MRVMCLQHMPKKFNEFFMYLYRHDWICICRFELCNNQGVNMESFMVKIIHWNCQLTKNKELPLIDNNKSYISTEVKIGGKNHK
jgi:hypothetical protein